MTLDFYNGIRQLFSVEDFFLANGKNGTSGGADWFIHDLRDNAIISWRGRSGLEPWSATPCSFTYLPGFQIIYKILSKL